MIPSTYSWAPRPPSEEIFAPLNEFFPDQQANPEILDRMKARDLPASRLPISRPISNWVLGELIGRGPRSRVFLGLDFTTGNLFAVKQAANVSRTVVESLQSLSHPNIARYLGSEETSEYNNIFLEYVPGGSIRSGLISHGKFNDYVIRHFTGQILLALKYLHCRGIVHQDLTSSNVLVEQSGICKLTDFGLSEVEAGEGHKLSGTSSERGSLFCMTPQLSETQGTAIQIDIRSVAQLVLEMWVGQPLWVDIHNEINRRRIMESDVPPPAPDGIVLSEPAAAFRLRCFAKTPKAAELRMHSYLSLPPNWVFDGL